ncbi:(2,3-dihydroxybenzoyl)adenylate synthase [Nocardiopsis composta]|uniref:2,3-dihydroxybenzoate-AMP ligase n=1 Tax=Nocardiopsis composta TaxID=157465 RepID=A0A7W8VH33_9ACTN|nr:AMP-binding protein [Nocardiopsis composta]MBB5436211.1 2,3-dihydroxybenzoate-AMP ligase [Nocardiopsis composta]
MTEGRVPWSKEFADRYREEGLWQGVPLGDLLRGWAERYGDRTALVAGGRRWSYRELDRRVDRLAAGLHRLGIAAGDRVVVQLPNRPSFVAVVFALLRLGAPPVIAMPAHRFAEIAHFCSFTGAAAYITAERDGSFDNRELAREVQAEVPGLRRVIVDGDPGGFTALSEADADPVPLPSPAAEDLALLLLSGGTTGVPKLVPRTHDDWACSGRAMAEAIPFGAGTVTMVGLPIAHNWTMTHGMLAAFIAGGTLVLAPGLDPESAFPLVEAERVTDVGLVPSMAALWVEEAEWTGHDLSSLRRVAVGGAKLGEEAAKAVEPALGCRLQQMFGMAEGLIGFVRDDDPDELRTVSQGRPASPADEVRVVDEADREVAPGEVGELLARGPYTVRGYYRSPGHDAVAFTPDGFYRTGDLVRILPGGHVVFEGRVKEQINRGGEKVAAEEVQGHLLAHPDVRDVLVVGVPDDVLGERVCACVVPEGEPPSLAGLRDFLTRLGLAAYKLPDRVEAVDELPRTALGKPSRKLMLQRLLG